MSNPRAARSAFRKASPAPDIRLGQTVCHFQPIVKGENGGLAGFEALVRLRSGNQLLPPQAFLPHLERDGLLPSTDHAVFAQACAFLKSLPKGANVFVSVNISPQTLAQGHLARRLLEKVRGHDLCLSQLKIEILEGPPQERVGKGQILPASCSERRMITALHAVGFSVCFDDFGTGHTDVKRLDGFDGLRPDGPPSGIKVDRTLLPKVREGKAQDLDGALDLLNRSQRPYTLVFEGVRTKDITCLKSYCYTRDCHRAQVLFQGHELGAPMGPDQARTLVYASCAPAHSLTPL